MSVPDFRPAVAGIALGGLLALSAAPILGQEEEPWRGIPDPPVQVTPPPQPWSDPVVAPPGAQYANGGLGRWLLGKGNRAMWTTPHEIPVLDLGSFGGGVVPDERGGTSQSVTLHLTAADGREYIFRSVDKWTHQGLPHDLRLTPAGRLIQDQTGALHPGGAFVLPPLLEAAGVLHVVPRLYVMPDDPRLGEFRETFAGMVGIVVLRPNEGEEGERLFADAEVVAGMDRLLEHLEEDPGHRANTTTFLKARLVDILVGDSDRGEDNWRWARYGTEGRYLWEPIPRDRDWALIRVDGLLPTLGKKVYPKLATFGPEIEMDALTKTSQGQDRILLSELPRSVWDSVALALRADLTDEVIRKAAWSLPPEQAALQADELARVLRVRRDKLPEVADAWYRRISTEVDVRATDGGDRAEIERLDDGAVRVTLLWPVDRKGRTIPPPEDEDEEEEDEESAAEAEARPDTAGWAPYFTRRFLPDETREVRVYMHGGDDRAVVRGEGPEGIRVRVIGGGGDDHLVDASVVAGRPGAGTVFHDARGDNRLEPAAHTGVDTRRWEDPEPANWLADKLSDEVFEDWGGSAGWTPFMGYSDVAGPVIGGSFTWTRYGFRQVPWSRQLSVGAKVGLLSGGVGVDASLHTRRPNSPVRFSLEGRGSMLETFRFHGFGNDTPLGSDPSLDLAEERVLLLQAGVHRDWGAPGRPTATVSLTPEVRYTEIDASGGSALERLRPPGADGFGQAGLRLSGRLDRSRGDARPAGGFALEGGAGAFAPVWDAAGWFGDAHALARTWLALGGPVTLALRGGAERVWGDFPVHEAAFLGGRGSLRGFRYRRFAGDAAAHGAAELRVRLAEVTLLTRGRLGVSGITDTGRVWTDGESDGPWHVGYGMGVWFESLGAVMRVTWARGEEDRIYAGLGMSF